MGGDEDLATRVGEIETKGEKSEVQGDLQIPSSLVALAPLCFSLSLSLLLIPAQFSQSFFHFSESRAVETYTKYVLYIHVCTCTCAYICVFAFVFVRHRGVIARATKRRFAVLPLPRVLKELDRFIGIDSIPFR